MFNQTQFIIVKWKRILRSENGGDNEHHCTVGENTVYELGKN